MASLAKKESERQSRRLNIRENEHARTRERNGQRLFQSSHDRQEVALLTALLLPKRELTTTEQSKRVKKLNRGKPGMGEIWKA